MPRRRAGVVEHHRREPAGGGVLVARHHPVGVGGGRLVAPGVVCPRLPVPQSRVPVAAVWRPRPRRRRTRSRARYWPASATAPRDHTSDSRWAGPKPPLSAAPLLSAGRPTPGGPPAATTTAAIIMEILLPGSSTAGLSPGDSARGCGSRPERARAMADGDAGLEQGAKGVGGGVDGCVGWERASAYLIGWLLFIITTGVTYRGRSAVVMVGPGIWGFRPSLFIYLGTCKLPLDILHLFM